MIRNIITTLTLFLMFLAVDANAQKQEKVVMKDGSTLEGHTLESVPGKILRFQCEVATIVLTDKCISSVSDANETDITSLSHEWQEWANNNPELVSKHDGHSYLTLSTISFAPKQNSKDSINKDKPKADLLYSTKLNYGQVFFLERGSEYKYVDVTSTEYTINYSDIEQIDVSPRKPNVISGTVDVIEKKNGGVVEGQIVCHKINQSEKILKSDGSGIEVIPLNNIKSKQTRALNDKQTFNQQVEFLDRVYTKSSGTLPAGIITTQIVAGAKDSHILVRINDNDIRRVATTDIASICKESNPDYIEPLTDIIVKNDSFYINRRTYAKCEVKEGVDEFLYIQTDPDTIDEVSLSDVDGKFSFECINSEENADIKVIQTVLQPEKKSLLGIVQKKQDRLYCFRYKDITNKAIKPVNKADVSPNNTLKREYQLQEGTYVFFRNSDKKCIIFRVVK